MEGRNSLRINLAAAFSLLLVISSFPLSSLKVKQASGWGSTVVHLDWNARLMITLVAEDGRPLDGAWVYIVDAYTGENVTAAMTDEHGHAGTLAVETGYAAPPLLIEPGDRVDIGFNLLRGWFWLDEDKRLTGEPVNPDWDPVSNNIPPQPAGDEYIQYVSFNGRTGWARFYGKYYVIVYYRPAGCSDVLGPVSTVVVFDSYTAETQYQYIYLGIRPESYAATSEYGVSQAKIFRANVGDMVMSFNDAQGRPLKNVHVVLEEWGLSGFTDESGTLLFEKMPRISYRLTAEWVSRYGSKAVVKTTVTEDTVIVMPIYDVVLRLLSPKGRPLTAADVYLEEVYLGKADANGEVLATQVPSGNYTVSAKWLDSELVFQKIGVSTGGEITLTPSNVHSLTITVRGAQGQALQGAGIVIMKNGFELTRFLTDKGGNAEVELPDGEYTVEVSYGQFLGRKQVSLTRDSLAEFKLDVFLELLGVGMTLSQTILLMLAIMMLIIAIAIIIHEYHVYRRKKLPQLFAKIPR
ncbi:MAG: carboxypeptidase-like regulatory domain-containing protein [Thermoproteota archaeon]